MQILLCIDDTDNIESAGTGELAESIAKTIEEKGWGKCYGITRHQLLIHEDIPYTSHNSSMCFKADIKSEYLRKIIEFSSNFLLKESATGSDPGLCVVVVDKLLDRQKLIDFGYKAKKCVLTKDEAYKLANDLNLHLSEHGGTGQGIIGALAGVGLRLTGNNGRFKGKHKINADHSILSVKELCSYPGIDIVKSLDGEIINASEMVLLSEKVKTVLLEDKSVLLVYKKNDNDGFWNNCTKQQLRSY